MANTTGNVRSKQEWGGALAHFEDPAANVLTLVG
jgi:hypothetical protein